MGRKNTLVYQLATSQSLAASFQTDPTIVLYLDNCSYQINVTTTDSVGQFSVQASNDYFVDPTTGAVKNAGHWIPLSLAGGSPSVNAQNDTIMINLNQLPFYAIRLAYTAQTPGTGTCDIYIADKQLA